MLHRRKLNTDYWGTRLFRTGMVLMCSLACDLCSICRTDSDYGDSVRRSCGDGPWHVPGIVRIGGMVTLVGTALGVCTFAGLCGCHTTGKCFGREPPKFKK